MNCLVSVSSTAAAAPIAAVLTATTAPFSANVCSCLGKVRCVVSCDFSCANTAVFFLLIWIFQQAIHAADDRLERQSEEPERGQAGQAECHMRFPMSRALLDRVRLPVPARWRKGEI